MRIAATILNIGLIALLSFLLLTKGAPRGGEVFTVVVAFAAPITSLIALWLWRSKRDARSWASLFFERKRLEEQQRIDQLRSKSGGT